MAKRKRSILLLAYFLFRAKRWKEARSTLFEGFSQAQQSSSSTFFALTSFEMRASNVDSFPESMSSIEHWNRKLGAVLWNQHWFAAAVASSDRTW
jgi:hypothetical protein